MIGHVVQNALDATRDDGEVWLRLCRRSGQALVEVGDTGTGMSQEFVQTALFKPFQTTKEAGWASAPTRASSTCASWAAASPSTASRAAGP